MKILKSFNIHLFVLLLMTININFIKPKSVAFFSPDDNPKKKLINLIDQTKHKIKIAIYILTEKDITNALLKAIKRGVKIEIVTDQENIKTNSEKINLLKDNGAEIFVYSTPKTNKFKSIMHNKFAIFYLNDNKQNIDGNKWLWTGSFNWTRNANNSNQENVILTSNKNVFSRYEEQFESLKKRCCLNPKFNSKPIIELKTQNTKDPIKKIKI